MQQTLFLFSWKLAMEQVVGKVLHAMQDYVIEKVKTNTDGLPEKVIFKSKPES